MLVSAYSHLSAIALTQERQAGILDEKMNTDSIFNYPVSVGLKQNDICSTNSLHQGAALPNR